MKVQLELQRKRGFYVKIYIQMNLRATCETNLIFEGDKTVFKKNIKKKEKTEEQRKTGKLTKKSSSVCVFPWGQSVLCL